MGGPAASHLQLCAAGGCPDSPASVMPGSGFPFRSPAEQHTNHLPGEPVGPAASHLQLCVAGGCPDPPATFMPIRFPLPSNSYTPHVATHGSFLFLSLSLSLPLLF